VLVLYGERLSIPAMRLTEQGLSAGLARAHPWDLEIFSEYLDLTRLPMTQYGDELLSHLRTRYGTLRLWCPFRSCSSQTSTVHVVALVCSRFAAEWIVFSAICLALTVPGPEFSGRGAAVEERSCLQLSTGNGYEKGRQTSPRNCRSTIRRDPR
jgi:hypothetical protein